MHDLDLLFSSVLWHFYLNRLMNHWFQLAISSFYGRPME